MAAVGIVAVLFSAVWVLAVFPGMKKIPADYHQTADLEGTYSVVANQDFLIQLLSNPGFQRLLSSPATLQVLGNPATGQFLASDALKGLLANPAVLQAVLTNPQAAAQANPQVAQVLANPAAQALLGDPVIRGILSAPAGGPLLLDARTLKLLADPAHPAMQDIPIHFHRVRTTESVDGDKLVIHQDFDASIKGVGTPLPQLSSKNTLVVDRQTRQYLPGGSEPRVASFSFPFDTSAAASYSLWSTEVYMPVTAVFEKEDTVSGVKVLNFRAKVSGVTLNDAAKKDNALPTSLDLKADADIFWQVEPQSGIPVNGAANVTYKLNSPALGNPPVFVAKTAPTADSVANSVDDAKSANAMLFMGGVLLPSLVALIGSLLFIGGSMMPSKPAAKKA